ncbi:hypothetical protein P9139_20275 [Curtobacterium flaccumfaciens]|nr:hypothetical protein P9139_20275 [Curtobacterium flaccumfaciens]
MSATRRPARPGSDAGADRDGDDGLGRPLGGDDVARAGTPDEDRADGVVERVPTERSAGGVEEADAVPELAVDAGEQVLEPGPASSAARDTANAARAAGAVPVPMSSCNRTDVVHGSGVVNRPTPSRSASAAVPGPNGSASPTTSTPTPAVDARRSSTSNRASGRPTGLSRTTTSSPSASARPASSGVPTTPRTRRTGDVPAR